jgi:hypothetical protein
MTPEEIGRVMGSDFGAAVAGFRQRLDRAAPSAMGGIS